QMIEEQSFDNAEGFSAIHKFYEALEKKGKEAYLDNMTAGLAKLYVNTVEKTDKILEKTIKTPLLKRMSAAYLAEDMTPKLATYMQFRKRGLSIEQSVMMVSRKFPQYKTVGKTIQVARRYAFPWITFPAEVTRVMRNNMVDRPLASAMWFQASSMQQAVMSGIGFAPTDPAEVAAAKEAAPFWANKPSTVITSAAGQGVVGGGFTGAALGGIAGALKAGPLGFAVGSAAGAVIGAGIGAYGSKGEDSLRAWTLDFLPHSAVLPQSYDTHMDPGSNMVKEFLKISPVEPLSVMIPLIRLMMGEDEYGQEIVGEGKLDYLSKAVVQTAGIVTPPRIQKYGLRVG
ncbi:MAG: hypothetical protein MN733_40960, partial [Nitrososphaera sp.]|nr:hypothetical protein [Nitrososphaera sp.]